MAQHIPIEYFKQKRFKTISKNIQQDLNKRSPESSFKYDCDNSDFYRENEQEKVCFATRYVGKGFVYGSNNGSFEIHYDKHTRKINKIYFVA